MRSLRFLLLTVVLSMPFAASRAKAEPIGLLERYALASDREAVLRELIPGSEDFFFLHTLHYQVTGQLEKAEAMLVDWEKQRRPQGDTPALRSMRDRQRLLTYGISPDRSIEYLIERLQINHQHGAPRKAGQRQWPSSLDNSLLNPDQIIEQSLRGGTNLSQSGLARVADRLLDGKGAGLPVDLQWLSRQINGRWYPRLAELVIAELKARPPQEIGFGDRPCHASLTLDELQKVFGQFPSLAANDTLISAILQRLKPNEDTDLAQQPDVRLEYLRRVEAFTNTLPAAQNSLKAAALYRLLDAHLERDEFPRDLFLRYLKLPRQSPIVLRRIQESSRGILADLNRDYSQLAHLPPINNEEPLVRAYLEHFLKDARSSDDFQALVEANYLRRVFAETKIIYGIGDPQQWYPMLSPAERTAITERIELTLARSNPTYGDPTSPSKLTVDIKNVDELIVRIYQINSHAYYRENDKPIDTDLDLDGLVPTVESRFEYSQADRIRHREVIDLPNIQGRGVWMIDLLGGGLRARAILRRGHLRVIEQITPNGNQFVVLNEQRQPVANATMLLAGQTISSDEAGLLVVPPSDRPLTRKAVLMDSELAIPVTFAQTVEDYQLKSKIAINRQQLRSGQNADLLVRSYLTLSNEPVDPATLKEATLTVVATDQDGIETTRRYENLSLSQNEETLVRFRTPSRLAHLSATLSGRIALLATGREVELSDAHQWDLNDIEATEQTNDLHLTRNADRWIIEVRGINGEPVQDETVVVRCTTHFSPWPIEATLEPDSNGTIDLGPLSNVTSITMSGSRGALQTRQLRLTSAIWPARIHGVSGESLQLPLDDPNTKVNVDTFLYSVVTGAVVSDITQNSLSIESGNLNIGPLEPGDYWLVYVRDGSLVQTSIAITDGPVVQDIAAGQVRDLQLRWNQPVTIANVVQNTDGLEIQLGGDLSKARVHIIGSRYFTNEGLLGITAPVPTMRGVDLGENGYISNLRLGEEYLYVLRRQYAKKYPGVMLPQTSLLLAPWVTDTTTNEEQSAALGDAPMASAKSAPRDRMADGIAAEKELAGQASISQSLNFLPNGGVFLANLRPDEKGVIRISKEILDTAPVVQITLVDPLQTVQRTVFTNLSPLTPRDLRLTNPLPIEEAYAFNRGVLLAGPDRPLDLATIGTAQLQTYTNVADLLRLYRTLTEDTRLDEFLALGKWHTLDDAAKESLYGRLACHEVNVFIKAHDPQFFSRVVRPYLENKLEKQLVDHWLLDRDLSPWTDLWQYGQLNAFEKAILAREVPEIRTAVIREMRDILDAQPDDATILRRLVEFGLAGNSMAEGAADKQRGLFFGAPAATAEAFGINAMEAEAMDAMPAPGAMGGGGMGGGMGGFAGGAPARGGEARKRSTEMLGRRAMGRAANFFQQLDSTKQWAENHWDYVRKANAAPSLIDLDPFWLDWVEASDNPVFMSEHLLRPSNNRHAALIALAILGLPLEAGSVEFPESNEGLFTPSTPVAIVTKRLQKIDQQLADASVLVGQRFDRIHTAEPVDESKPVKIAPDEFLVGEPYYGQIVLTNPTPQQQIVECFWQIPAGSLPLASSQATDSQTVTIEPFQVEMIEYQFYFPIAGSFEHYPVCLTADEKLIARGVPRTFRVVEQFTEVDENSWEQIALNGNAQRIGEYLKTANLQKIDWSVLLHRLRDKAVYDVVLAIVDDAQLWSPEVWGYAFLHRDRDRMKTFLEQQQTFAEEVGPVLHCDLMDVDPIVRVFYEHLEYSPLVQARIHPLRDEPEILNNRLLEQYRSLMKIVAFQPSPTANQQLALCYYMLIQNRIEEAIPFLNAVSAEEIETKLQLDYFTCYIALHQGNYELAAQVAEKHSQHPVPRWQARFASIQSQLAQRRDLIAKTQLVGEQTKPADSNESVREDDADLALMDRERRQAEGSEGSTDIRVRVEGDQLIIDYRNAREATVNFYGVDLELLFSKTPMIEQGLQRMAIVQPMRTEALSLGDAMGTATLTLSDEMTRQTLLVEVVAGAARDTALVYGGRLKTYVSEGFGQLQVSDRTTGAPVDTAYVKVYSRSKDGRITFYKDGYTDLRGRFDYATLSTGNLGEIDRFSILVLDPERGATLHEVMPPTR